MLLVFWADSLITRTGNISNLDGTTKIPKKLNCLKSTLEKVTCNNRFSVVLFDYKNIG